MQIREWIASQSILNPVASAASNTTKTNGSTDAFSQLFEGKRMIRPERPPNANPVIQKPLYGEAFKVRKPVEKPIYKTDSSPKEVKSDSLKEVQTETVDETNVDEETSLKKFKTDEKALKDKIKSMTGLSEDEINNLISMMGIGLDELETMIQKLPVEFFGLFEDMQITLSNLEVNNMLNQPIEPALIEKLTNQLEQMQSLMTVETIETDSSLAESELFNKVLTQLTEVTTQLKSLSEKDNVDFEDISKLFESAPKSTVEVKTEKQSDEKVFDSLIGASKEDSTKLVQVKLDTSNQNQSFDSKSDQTAQKLNLEEAVPQINVETVESDNAIAFHQLVMKQPGLVSVQTVQATQVLRQDVLSQVMDAIRGNIKIDENGTSMLVKLQPEQLGNVELKLNIHKGLVMAEIKVENEIVKAAIESNLDDLRQNLSNKGFTVNQISVSVDSGKKEQQQAFYESENGKKSGGKNVAGISDEMDKEDNLSYYSDEDSSNTIDYLG